MPIPVLNPNALIGAEHALKNVPNWLLGATMGGATGMLSDKERNQHKAQHKQERDGRVRDRIKAVLLHDKGWSPQQIAEALLISDQAVRNHLSE